MPVLFVPVVELATFNRTTLELKYTAAENANNAANTFNRTTLELKYWFPSGSL